MSSGRKSKWRSQAASRLKTFLLDTCTPLGLPVDPDVNDVGGFLPVYIVIEGGAAQAARPAQQIRKTYARIAGRDDVPQRSRTPPSGFRRLPEATGN